MRQLQIAFSLLFFLSIISCSDSGTGPDPDSPDPDSGNSGETVTSTYDVSISIIPSDAGTISPSVDDTYDEGEEIELQANPNDGYVFTGWTGDIESNNNPHSLTVNQDYNITANFELKSYELTVNKEGEGTVSEEVLEQKSKEYEHGTVVELTANPAEGYKFVEWKGDVTGTENPAQITVDAPKELTAVFKKKSYALTINTDGEGAVSEEVVQQKSIDFEHGTVVELTASPATGWKFVEWQGANATSDNPIQVTVDSPKEVTAVFEKKSFMLSTTITGQGAVKKDPDQQEYLYNTAVKLQANPDIGYEFLEWTGDITVTSNPLEITIDTSKTIGAVFEKMTFPITLNKSGEGSVSKSPDQTEYEYGSSITLTATPAKGYTFTGWQGDTTATANEIIFTIKEAKEFTAVFEKKSYTLTTNTTGEGSVEASPSQSEYLYNSSVELTATPSKGWKFVEWTGDVSSTTNPLSFTMDTAKTITAVFEKKSFTLSIEKMGEGSVTLSPNQIKYEYGSQVELSASSSGDWTFDKWDGDISSTTNPIIITIDTTKSIIAKFKNTLFAGGYGTEENPYQISTVEHLNAAANYPESNFELISNIDATLSQYFNNGKGLEPIGSPQIPFTGKFYGKGYKITEPYIIRDSENYVGLFGYIQNGSVVGLTLELPHVKGNDYVGAVSGYNDGYLKSVDIIGVVEGNDFVGGLVGQNDSNGIIWSCSTSSSNVSSRGNHTIGGLVGFNVGEIRESEGGGARGVHIVGGLIGENRSSKIFNSISSSTVTGDYRIGGLIGLNIQADLKNLHATGGITSRSVSTYNQLGNVGGLIGENQGGIVENSYATGSISFSDGKYIGGLIGQNKANATIKYSFATGNFSGGGSSNIGGLVGLNELGAMVEASYASGDINGQGNLGGLVGVNNGNISESYAFGEITGWDPKGGLIGANNGDVKSSYWDVQSSTLSNGVGEGATGGMTGLDTQQMTGDAAKMFMTGFDFTETWKIWSNSNFYPALFWENDFSIHQ